MVPPAATDRVAVANLDLDDDRVMVTPDLLRLPVGVAHHPRSVMMPVVDVLTR